MRKIVSLGVYGFVFCGVGACVSAWWYASGRVAARTDCAALCRSTLFAAETSTVDVRNGEDCWLDRDHTHLYVSAVEFAGQKGMQKEVDGIYRGQQPQRRRRSSLSDKKKQKSFQKRAVAVSAGESRFSLPLAEGSFWVSSPFGPRKKADGRWKFHHGIDMAAVRGTPVKAAAAGRVVYAGNKRGYGNTVELLHKDGYTTRYAHLDSIGGKKGKKIGSGINVARGECIATVGATGFVQATGNDGSHLHFEVIRNGERIDPSHFLQLNIGKGR